MLFKESKWLLNLTRAVGGVAIVSSFITALSVALRFQPARRNLAIPPKQENAWQYRKRENAYDVVELAKEIIKNSKTLSF